MKKWLFLLPFLTLHAAPQGISPQQLKNQIDYLQLELDNQATDLKFHEERFHHLEHTLDAIERQVSDEGQVRPLKEHLKAFSQEVSAYKQDLQALKKHADKATDSLNQTRTKLDGLEKTVQQQDQTIATLKNTLNQVLQALDADTTHTYKIQNGDSLDKIARRFKTSVQQLKELNNLTSDRIIVGQTLRVPQS